MQASADAISPNGFRTVMEIDALGTFAASRAAFPALKASGDAAIINITATLQYGATWWQVTTLIIIGKGGFWGGGGGGGDAQFLSQ